MTRNALRLVLFAAAILGPLTAARATEIRTCGPELRTAPLNEARRVQSLLLQSFAVVNDGPAPVRLDELTLDLLDKGVVRDARILGPADIARAASAAPRIEALAKFLPSQFCNGKLLEGVKLAHSETLAPGEAVIFLQQLFVWSGARDTLRIKAPGASASLRISSEPSRTKALFPLAGRYFVGIGPSLHGHHRWVALQEFSYDIAAIGNGRTFRGKGTRAQDYLIYGAPVRAVAAGRVAKAVTDKPNSVDQLQRPGESDDAYLTRVGEAQDALVALGFDAILGNHVVIDHGNGEFSVYAHLKPGSVKVKGGDPIAAGQVFAAVGTSGNSTQPHLHFQLSDCAEVEACQSIPVSFEGIRLPVEQTQRALQSGDLVETIR
jgi:murein DD-endopeptidase MepM/ murein hydrolase activator NlpD